MRTGLSEGGHPAGPGQGPASRLGERSSDQEVKTVGYCHGGTKGSQSAAGEASPRASNKLTFSRILARDWTSADRWQAQGCDDLRRTLRDKQDELMETIAALCCGIDGLKAAGSSQSVQRTGKRSAG